MEKKKKEELVNCLRNERIIVRHIPKQTGLVTDPRHVLYGGMAENAVKTFVVPRLSSGLYVNVLTDSEKAFLEDIMGLEPNALSIYKKVNNFWDDGNEMGISRVRLYKQDNIFDLSDPDDYIRYKILLANKDYIAPSLKALEDYPKSTYQFVIIAPDDEAKVAKRALSATMQCYKEFGKYEEDKDTLRLVVEILEGKPLAKTTKLEYLQAKVNDLIIANPRMFLNVITDELLATKVMLRRCIDEGIVVRKADFIYTVTGEPLCEANQDPTFNNAAAYLNLPKNQELKFTLEAKLQSNDA